MLATEVLGRGCSLWVLPPSRSQGTGMVVRSLGHHGQSPARSRRKALAACW